MPNPIWSRVAALAADPEALTARLAASPLVPGVAVAAVSEAGVRVAAAGTADVESGRPVDAGTRFRPGSITKLLTAVLAMQCVEDGLARLDDPAVVYLPELEALSDPVRARRVTIRHLLVHSSGIDAGDLFVDTGAGDDCRAAYAEALAGTGFLFEPGAFFSYNNAGMILAGLLVERLRACQFEEAASRHVLQPLGMEATTFVPGDRAGEDATGDRAARGHRILASGTETVAWPIPDIYTRRAMAPAGGTLVSTAGDLATLVASLTGLAGVAPVVSRRTAEEMTMLATPAPGGVAAMRGVGIGWQVWHGSVRAAGANPGQSGVIAVDADRAVGVVVLTNGETGVNAAQALLDPQVVANGSEPMRPIECYAGMYASHAMRATVATADGGLTVEIDGFPGTATLVPLDGMTFSSPLGPVAFLAPDGSGRTGLCRWRMRVLRRAG